MLIAKNVVPQTLVVELGTDLQTYYCGWTGLSASESVLSNPSAGECVVLGPVLASLFDPPIRDGSSVSIRLFRSPPVPVAAQVFVTPASPDDWEVLSVHAEEVESSMLSQVRAAKQGQVLAVAVGRTASTAVRFTVDRTVPPTRPLDADAEDTASIAVRLSTDSEVIIAPRERAPVPESARDDVIAKTSDGPLSQSAAQAALSHILWRVLPLSYVIENDNADLSWIMVVSTSYAGASTERPSFELVHLAFPQGKVCITKVACPSLPKPENDKPANATASAAFAPGTWAAASAATEEWPAQHVWMGASLREKLSIHDFDLVCLSLPPPGAMRETGILDAAALPLRPAPLPAAPAGMDSVLQSCLHTVSNVHHTRTLEAAMQGRWDVVLDAPRATAPSNVRPYASTGALLLTGPTGSGKTTVARALGERLAANAALLYHTTIIDCAAYVEERLPLVRARFKEWLDDTAWHAPAILVLDNLDLLVPAEAENVDATRTNHLARALADKAQDVVRDYNVVLLATAQSDTSINSILQHSRLWTTTLAIKPPAKDERRTVLEHLVASFAARAGTASPALDWVALVGHTDGYHMGDLCTLTERAVHRATIRCLMHNSEVVLCMDDYERAREHFTPISLRSVKLEDSSTNWADIGGLHDTRRVLRETIEWPTKYAAIFANCPLRLRSGLLLYGYPGCGKTLLASAVAKECGLNFVSVKGPEILNKYIGASEKSVRDLFERAQAAKPCVLFFDEFDSIAPKRGHDSTGVTDRVVNQMLTQMDGAEGLDGVYVLAATSRPDLIDAALLRPGRLDKSLLCDMPSRTDRADILRAVARKVHVDASVDLNDWAERTDGFTGADLQALLYNAHLEAIHEAMEPSGARMTESRADVAYVSIASDKDKPLSGAESAAFNDRLHRMLGGAVSNAAPRAASSANVHADTPRFVHARHLASALRSSRPSVPRDEVQRLSRIYRQFAGDRDGVFPDGSASNAIGARTSLM